MAGGALHSGCCTNLVEESLLTSYALLGDATAKDGAGLLGEQLDVGRKLLGNAVVI